MVVDRALGQVEALRDLAVAQPAGDELGDLTLAATELQAPRGANRFRGGGRRFRSCREQRPRARDTREDAYPAIAELEARPDDEIFDGAGDEHLAGLGRLHHARSYVQGDASRTAIADLTLTCVHARTNPKPKVEELVAHVERAADSPGRPVEDGCDAALARVDLAARIPRESRTHDGMMAVDKLAPALVAEPDRVRTGLSHVRAQDGRQHRVRRRRGPHPCEELLDLTEDEVGVAEVRSVVDRVELKKPRIR